MKRLYKLDWYCEDGKIEGLFIATKEEVETEFGKQIFFGEIFGEYIITKGTFDKCDVIELKVSQQTIEELEKIAGKTISGYNPFDFIIEE